MDYKRERSGPVTRNSAQPRRSLSPPDRGRSKVRKTSTERSQERRKRIYSDFPALHQEIKEKDAQRKRIKSEIDKRKRETSYVEEERQRSYQREKKRKYREKLKAEKAKENESLKLNTPQKKKQKMVTNRIRRKLEGKFRSETGNDVNKSVDEQEQVAGPSQLMVSTTLWNCLSPGTKKRARTSLQDSTPEIKAALRKELGLNLYKSCLNQCDEENKETGLQRKIIEFFERQDVCRTCPDTKRMISDPEDKDTKVPARYRLGSVKMLHHMFECITGSHCSLWYFRKEIPFDVVKPKPNDWGTCLCAMCINPEIKLETLAKVTKDPSFLWDDEKGYDDIDELVEKIQAIKSKDDINYNEWRQVEINKVTRKKKRKSKVSRKVAVTEKFGKFREKLVKELKVLQSHLESVHSQYKAFKQAREEAEENDNVATVQADWSENKRLIQCGEEKGAYYYEDQVSIHPVYTWTSKSCFSRAALGDSSDHKAPAVMASLKDVLKDLVKNGIKKIIVVTDSPTSQYRNKSIFWYIKKFCEENNISVRWIYLESGHGKGIADGIGATVKRAIHDLMGENPGTPMYTVEDLLKHGLQESLPSVQLHTYNQDDIDEFYRDLPKLVPITGTMKVHEVRYDHSDSEVTISLKNKSSDPNTRPASLVIDLKKKTQKKTQRVDPSSTSEAESEQSDVESDNEADTSDTEVYTSLQKSTKILDTPATCQKRREAEAIPKKNCVTDDDIQFNIKLLLKKNDCVKIVRGDFCGFYANVQDVFGDDTYEIAYFKESYGKYILDTDDRDTRPVEDLIRVQGTMHSRMRYTFDN